MKRQQLRCIVIGLALASAAASSGAGWRVALEPLAAVIEGRHQAARTATGTVTGVSDGDTFYMQIEGQSVRMRLAQIDAPEKAQAFGRRSEQSLRELIGSRAVTVRWTQADQYGRPVVHVEVDGVDVAAEQVRRGYAWAWPRYVTDANLMALQAEARAARRGLWSDPQPVEPWLYRKETKKRPV